MRGTIEISMYPLDESYVGPIRQFIERLHDAAQGAYIRRTGGTFTMHVLRRERNASRLRCGQSNATSHPPRVSRSPDATSPAATAKRASTTFV